MAAFRTSRTFDIVFLMALAGLLVMAYFSRAAIGDTVFFWFYHPTAETVRVAQQAGLSADGTHLLYRTNPQFENQTQITADCGPDRLGCLSPHGQAFILDDPSDFHQTVVTAAHEMLHLAYERLSSGDKADLAPLLDAGIALNRTAIEPELSSESDASDRRDEAHSLLGTEYQNLPAALVQYYDDHYFTDRGELLQQVETN